jgi:hypothetical protein
MAKQVVVNRETGERFETTRWLSVADASRITGYNGIRSAWKSIVHGGEVTLGSSEIGLFGSYLRPVVTQKPVAVVAQTASPMRWQDQPATARQLQFLAKLRVRFDLPLTKGQASRLIDAALEGDAAIEYEDGPSTSEVY